MRSVNLFASEAPPGPVEDVGGFAINGFSTVLIILAAFALTRLAGLGLRLSLRRIARLAAQDKRVAWRRRVPRIGRETRDIAELRRRHRIDAVADTLSRLTSIAIWLGTAILLLHLYDVDPLVALSSAGFLGVAIAWGAQPNLHDYIAGLQVLLEDRYGEGDEIEVTTLNGQSVHGTVTAVGAFATRIQTGDSTWHVANRNMTEVCNHSQRGITHIIEVRAPIEDSQPTHQSVSWAARAALAYDLRGRPGDTVVVDRVDAEAEYPDWYRVTLRANRRLSVDEQQSLAAGTQRRLEDIGV